MSAKYVPQCPHCGHRLPRLKSKFNEDEAVRRVLRLARRPAKVTDLAKAYAAGSDISRLSARRAIERLANSGHLVRVATGWYQTSPRGDR